MSSASGEELTLENDGETTDNPATEAATDDALNDVAEQMRQAAQRWAQDNPQQVAVLAALPPQQVQVQVAQAQQEERKPKRKLDEVKPVEAKLDPDEARKEARAKRFAKDNKLLDEQREEQARTQAAAFKDFVEARGDLALTGAWRKHGGERMFNRLSRDFGGLDKLIEFSVMNAAAAQVGYSKQQGTYEIMIREVLEALDIDHAEDIPTGRYTIAGKITDAGFEVFHCGKFG
ncbi:hypothetical protein [Actinophytocola oryzae]|uniref:Uncharacterized protein n=1 Tax=Actinophytocola oryzae TaxID=502181 RepID=A0A4R7VL87_9PSEU|nr:hypothetical protein [Actinophytocola oryzae]TDV49957.1 hypothetical protein CLV71_107305 [Actinophytocola oryzae]